MSKKLLAAAAAAALLSPAFAVAEESPHSFSANVGLFSQYVFRGLAQTNEEPAIQGGFDYAYAASQLPLPVTFYVGTWGSNISWLQDANLYSGGGSLELDIYGGVKGNFGKTDFTWDVGYLYYWYPGDTPAAVPPAYFIDADTQELYAALGWKWFTVKYSYSLSDTFGVDDAKGTNYWDFKVSYPVADSGVTLGAHYGIQTYDGNDPRNLFGVSNDDLFSYKDWSLSVAYDLGKAIPKLQGYELGAMYTDTDVESTCAYGSITDVGFLAGPFGAGNCTGIFPKNNADSQFVVWFKGSF